MKNWAWVAAFGATIVLQPVSGVADENGPKGCSIETLNGQYLGNASGTVFPPAFGVTKPTVSSVAAYSLYFGDGTGTDYVTQTLDGVKVPAASPTPTTYTLNKDCTGTKTVLNGPQFDIYVAVNGSELTEVATSAPPNHSPGFAVSARQIRANFDD
jgi:hypothetical protein